METPWDERARITLDGDRATVSFDQHYDHLRGDVWQAITDPAKLADWLDDSVVELRIGGKFEVHFSDAPMLGKITELDAGSILAYSWHEGREDVSHVRWKLTDEDTGTRLQLAHTGLPIPSAEGFAAGWHHHLERLAASLSGSQMAWDDDRFNQLRNEYRSVTSWAGGENWE